jgi:hypothetical protein
LYGALKRYWLCALLPLKKLGVAGNSRSEGLKAAVRVFGRARRGARFGGFFHHTLKCRERRHGVAGGKEEGFPMRPLRVPPSSTTAPEPSRTKSDLALIESDGAGDDAVVASREACIMHGRRWRR